MKAALRLWAALARGASGAAWEAYFAEAPEGEALALLRLSLGQRPKAGGKAGDLRAAAQRAANLPDWLWTEAEAFAGSLGEAAALCLPLPAPEAALPKLSALLAALDQGVGPEGFWPLLPPEGRRVVNALWLGRFRWAPDFGPLLAGLSAAKACPAPVLAARLARACGKNAAPLSAALWAKGADVARPAEPVVPAWVGPLEALGARGDWVVDWAPEAPQVLAVHPEGPVLWGPGGALGAPPEAARWAAGLPPGSVILGAAKARGVQVLDLRAWAGEAWQARPLAERRAFLATALKPPLGLSPGLSGDWAALTQSPAPFPSARLLLRALALPDQAWLWAPPSLAPPPLTALLLYIERGASGPERLSFGLARGNDFAPLVSLPAPSDPAAKALLRALAAEAVARFGPVQQVPPRLCGEIAHEGLVPAPRRKLGYQLLNPRLLRLFPDPELSALTPLADLVAGRQSP